jgi:hypothetical protein
MKNTPIDQKPVQDQKRTGTSGSLPDMLENSGRKKRGLRLGRPPTELQYGPGLVFTFAKSEQAGMPPPAPCLFERYFSEIDEQIERSVRRLRNSSNVIVVDFRGSPARVKSLQTCALIAFNKDCERVTRAFSKSTDSQRQLPFRDDSEQLQM